jgi:hypothetical protein
MKKLVLMFVAIAAISFASCGNKAAAPVVEEVDTAMVDTTVVDTTVVDTVVAE